MSGRPLARLKPLLQRNWLRDSRLTRHSHANAARVCFGSLGTFEQDRPVISSAGRNMVAAASGRFLPADEMTNRGEVERSGGQLATGRGRPRPLPPRCGSVALTAHEQDATVDRDWNR